MQVIAGELWICSVRWGCPVLGDIQGQAELGSEHLMELWVSLFVAGELD